MRALMMLAVVLVGAAGASPEPQVVGGTDLTATVRGVDAGANRFEVVTGVGHALRLYSMGIGPSCKITVEGRSATLAQLKRGQVVHLRYRKADEGRLAETIETLPKPPAGGER